jgi:hypothetical protein
MSVGTRILRSIDRHLTLGDLQNLDDADLKRLRELLHQWEANARTELTRRLLDRRAAGRKVQP